MSIKYKNIILRDVHWLDHPELIPRSHYRVQDEYADDVSYIFLADVKHPVFHRIDGPAYIRTKHDDVKFFFNGTQFTDTRRFCKDANMTDQKTFMWLLQFGDRLPSTIEEYYGKSPHLIKLEEL